jgi:flagellar hook assembly protein FlgD
MVSVTIDIYDIRGNLVRELINKNPRYPGWNSDQWDGTDESGKMVKNGRYFVVVTAETDSDKVSKVKHLAIFQ